jgi:DNA-binding transcriptional MerR regulator
MTAEATEYTIDDLATLTRVPSRTIRFYQSKGALPSPLIRGRVAYYGPAHVERLKLIGSLQDRGLSIRAIRDLLQQADKGELALNEWLGLEEQLQEPWANDRPRVLTEAELLELLGDQQRPGVIAELVKLRQIERHGDSYIIHSPALFQVGLRLAAAGIDFETGVGASEILRKYLGRAAGELTSYFYKHLDESDVSEAYRALRPFGQEAVRVIFGKEMEKALRKLVDSGAIRKKTKKR